MTRDLSRLDHNALYQGLMTGLLGDEHLSVEELLKIEAELARIEKADAQRLPPQGIHMGKPDRRGD